MLRIFFFTEFSQAKQQYSSYFKNYNTLYRAKNFHLNTENQLNSMIQSNHWLHFSKGQAWVHDASTHSLYKSAIYNYNDL